VILELYNLFSVNIQELNAGAVFNWTHISYSSI
jgi:hypothetical protein